MNNNVTEWALTLHNNDFLNRIMFFFSKIGKGGFVFWIIVLIYSAYFFFKKKDKKLTLLTLGYFISLGIAFVLIYIREKEINIDNGIVINKLFLSINIK